MKQSILKFGFMALIACFTLASCQKDNNPPDPNGNNNNGNGNNNGNNNNNSDTVVTLNDLVNYYFVYKNPDGKLRVIYFFNDNGSVNAYRDGLGNRRGMEGMAMNSNSLSCKFGSVDYTFRFSKQNSNISLANYTSSEGAYDNLQMFKVSDVPVFASTNATENIFNYSNNGNGVYLYFGYQNGNVWRYDCVNGPGNSMGYYLIGTSIGWKSNDEATFGVAVPDWAGNSNVKMLLESTIPDLGSGVQTAFEY